MALNVCVCFVFQYKLTVPKVGYISDLCTSLSVLSGVAAEKVRKPVYLTDCFVQGWLLRNYCKRYLLLRRAISL